MISLLFLLALSAPEAASAPPAVCDAKPFILKKPAPQPAVAATAPKPAPQPKAKIVIGCKDKTKKPA